jgi:hypothetical protein
MPPRRPKKPSRFDAIPAGASFEDDVQLDRLRHPWSLTFGEFLWLSRERYGLTYGQDAIGVAYIEGPSGHRIPLTGNLAMNDQLDEEETADLCKTIGLSPTDFGLPAEEPEEDGELD